MEATSTWTPHGGTSTRTTLRNRGEPRGSATIIEPLVGLAMRRENNKDLRRRKALLET